MLKFDLLRKEKYFHDIGSTFKKGSVKIEPLGKQSIQIKFPCNCTLTHHLYAERVNNTKAFKSKRGLKLANLNRSIFIEFCKEHKQIN